MAGPLRKEHFLWLPLVSLQILHRRTNVIFPKKVALLKDIVNNSSRKHTLAEKLRKVVASAKPGG